jgi:DNA-binding NarL/FixJ family response regulator
MKHALVVEDLPAVRAWLVELLRSAFPGIQVETTDRAADGAVRALVGRHDLALVDLGLPDGSGVAVVQALRRRQPDCVAVVVTIHDDDAHLFPALQAGAFGYLLKEQPREVLVEQLMRILEGQPPLSPPIARRVLAWFAGQRPLAVPAPAAQPAEAPPAAAPAAPAGPPLTERETQVLQLVARGFTQPEIAQQLQLSRHTVGDHIKQVYRKLDVSSRAEAALEAARRGLVRF